MVRIKLGTFASGDEMWAEERPAGWMLIKVDPEVSEEADLEEDIDAKPREESFGIRFEMLRELNKLERKRARKRKARP